MSDNTDYRYYQADNRGKDRARPTEEGGGMTILEEISSRIMASLVGRELTDKALMDIKADQAVRAAKALLYRLTREK